MKHDFEIETKRLILRAPTLGDAVEINAAMNEVWDDLQLWMSWAYDDQKTIEATRTYIEKSKEAGNIPLAGFCRESEEFVVSTGLNRIEPDIYETGYWMAKNFLGKGYATEAAGATIRYAFETLSAKKILINHYDGNEASRHIIEKLGFSKTGYEEKSHARCKDGTLLGTHHYALTHEQWSERCP